MNDRLQKLLDELRIAPPPKASVWSSLLSEVSRAMDEQERTLRQTEHRLQQALRDEVALEERLGATEVFALAEHERLEAILEALGAGVACVDSAGRLTSLNPEGCRLLGGGEEADYLQQELEAHFHPMAPAADLGLREVVDHGFCLRDRAVLRRDSSEIDFTMSPVGLANGNARAVIVFTEVASQGSERGPEHPDGESSRLLTNMSHEMRTPLNGILGMAEVLSGTLNDSQQRACVETIQGCANNLLCVINDLLEYAQLQTGRLVIEEVPYSPRQLVEDVGCASYATARKKELEIVCDVDFAMPETVQGDPARIRQILTHLVSNAVKFTHEGGVRLSVAPRTVSGREDRFLRYTVKDTGIGIPREVSEKIFTAFTQGDASVTRAQGGNGLGLSICNRLVKLMGGRIGFESDPGQGSRFWFELPLHLSHDDRGMNWRLPEHRGKILVVDSHAEALAYTGDLVAQWGGDVVTTQSGESALSILQRSPQEFTLLIFDRGSTPLDGIGLARAMLQSHLPRIPIVVLSPLGQCLSPAQLRAQGASACVPKPIKARRLFQALTHCLGPDGTAVEDGEDAGSEAPPKLSVLLVEDNAVNRRVATRLLERLGHEVHVAVHGEEALEMLQETRPDLVLMDLQMPVMDGLSATREIRRREADRQIPDDEALPIIALTAHSSEEDREECMAVGMDEHLGKPIDPHRLEEVLKLWANATETRRQRASAAAAP